MEVRTAAPHRGTCICNCTVTTRLYVCHFLVSCKAPQPLSVLQHLPSDGDCQTHDGCNAASGPVCCRSSKSSRPE